ITCPALLVSVTIRLLNEALMCASPTGSTATLRFLLLTFVVLAIIYLLFSGFLFVCYCLTFTLTCTGVVLGVLSAQRQTVTVTDTAIATYIHKTFDAHLHFGTQLTLHFEVVGYRLADQRKFI